MGKKKNWFTYVKRLFLPESKPKPEEKSKNWRWFIGNFKFRQYPAIEAPQRTLNEAAEERRKHAMAVAIATAAAAEAAVAAANAAAEVVWLTNIPYELERKNLHLAAIKIQAAYRGYLARKALSALKGIVKLQAVVRGELLRSSVVKKLASMCLFSKAQPLVHRKRVPTLLEYLSHGEKRHSLSQKEGLKSEELKLHSNTHRSWDLSLVSKEALYLRKQEAISKRECMKQYSFSHRERRNDQSLQESMTLKQNRRSIRFDQSAELEVHQREETEKLKPMLRSNTIAVDTTRLAQLKLRTPHKHETIEDLNSPFSLPRRSFCHVKQKSIGDCGSLPNSPIFPAYMAATESTKAKSRSLSTPKQRLRLCDTNSAQHSPYKLSLSSWSSCNGEITNTNKRNSISQQISSTLW
ncbi:hypothetical protein Pfo_003183 [Paulownia fortunei]|nr:hypothetical protein Pfo_003183 [Paulownia fortunei]